MSFKKKIMLLNIQVLSKLIVLLFLILWFLFPNKKFIYFCIRTYLFSLILNVMYMKIQFQGIYLFNKHLDKPYRLLKSGTKDEVTLVFPGTHIEKIVADDLENVYFAQNTSIYFINYGSSVQFCSEKNIINNTVKICKSIISKKVKNVNLIGRSFGTGLIFPVITELQKKNININNVLFVTPYTSLKDIVIYKMSLMYFIKILISSFIHGNYYDLKYYSNDVDYKSINKIYFRNALYDSIIPFELQIDISNYIKELDISKEIIIQNLPQDHDIAFM